MRIFFLAILAPVSSAGVKCVFLDVPGELRFILQPEPSLETLALQKILDEVGQKYRIHSERLPDMYSDADVDKIRIGLRRCYEEKTPFAMKWDLNHFMGLLALSKDEKWTSTVAGFFEKQIYRAEFSEHLLYLIDLGSEGRFFRDLARSIAILMATGDSFEMIDMRASLPQQKRERWNVLVKFIDENRHQAMRFISTDDVQALLHHAWKSDSNRAAVLKQLRPWTFAGSRKQVAWGSFPEAPTTTLDSVLMRIVMWRFFVYGGRHIATLHPVIHYAYKSETWNSAILYMLKQCEVLRLSTVEDLLASRQDWNFNVEEWNSVVGKLAKVGAHPQKRIALQNQILGDHEGGGMHIFKAWLAEVESTVNDFTKIQMLQLMRFREANFCTVECTMRLLDNFDKQYDVGEFWSRYMKRHRNEPYFTLRSLEGMSEFEFYMAHGGHMHLKNPPYMFKLFDSDYLRGYPEVPHWVFSYGDTYLRTVTGESTEYASYRGPSYTRAWYEAVQDHLRTAVAKHHVPTDDWRRAKTFLETHLFDDDAALSGSFVTLPRPVSLEERIRLRKKVSFPPVEDSLDGEKLDSLLCAHQPCAVRLVKLARKKSVRFIDAKLLHSKKSIAAGGQKVH